jgi:cell wall-associated NlpC family hydrolase
MFHRLLGGALTLCIYTMPALASNPNKFTPQALDKVVMEAYSWQGTRYRYGGTDKRGIDCSHFVHTIYSQTFAGLSYRRADDYLVPDPEFALTTTPRPGDVIVFPAVRGLSAHVGILTNVPDKKFIGSQTSTGVKETSYASGTYWGKRPYQIMSAIKN